MSDSTDQAERPGLSRAEPPPIANDSPAIWELVIADMRDRDNAGRAKYGTPLQAGNGRDPLVDGYQEALDLAVYLRQAIAERWVRREEHDRACAERDELRERVRRHEQAASRLRLPVSVGRDAKLADQGGILCSSPGGADCPAEGWHYVFGGPYTSYTMPEPDERGTLSWCRLDEDEGCWREFEDLGIVLVRDEDLGLLADAARSWAAHSPEDRDDIMEALRSSGLGSEAPGTAAIADQAAEEQLADIGLVQVVKFSRAGVMAYTADGPRPRELRQPDQVFTRGQLATHVGVPVVDEPPWVKAIDGIVDTWVGREIEVFDSEAPWVGRLRSIQGGMLRVDYNDQGDVRCLRVARDRREVRLAKPAEPPPPVDAADGWVRSTDPIVGTWLGKRVELTSAHMAPWTVELVDVDDENLYTAEPERRARARSYMLEVRLAAEEPKQ